MKRLHKTIIMTAAAVLAAVVEFFILPDDVIIQISPSGAALTVIPKMLAILLPLGLSITGALLYYWGESRHETKFILLTFAGYLASAFMFIFNIMYK